MKPFSDFAQKSFNLFQKRSKLKVAMFNLDMAEFCELPPDVQTHRKALYVTAKAEVAEAVAPVYKATQSTARERAQQVASIQIPPGMSAKDPVPQIFRSPACQRMASGTSQYTDRPQVRPTP